MRIDKLLNIKSGRRLNVLTLLFILTLPFTVAYTLREVNAHKNFARLNSKNPYEKQRAVESLVQKCAAQRNIILYLPEYLFGTCRSLYGVKLANAHLRGSDLSGADLRNADLRNVNLRKAHLFNADLRNADLRNAILVKAYFTDANLRDANFIGAHIEDGVFARAELSGANFSNADLTVANMRYASLNQVDFSGANLTHVDFRHADLNEVNFYKANLTSAAVSSTNLENTNFQAAILLNTRIYPEQNLTMQQLEGESPPFICNALLPGQIEIDNNRDCKQLASVLHQRYPEQFESLQKAEEFVNEKRRENWFYPKEN